MAELSFYFHSKQHTQALTILYLLPRLCNTVNEKLVMQLAANAKYVLAMARRRAESSTNAPFKLGK